jgi:hypothetical protein
MLYLMEFVPVAASSLQPRERLLRELSTPSGLPGCPEALHLGSMSQAISLSLCLTGLFSSQDKRSENILFSSLDKKSKNTLFSSQDKRSKNGSYE